MPLYIVLFFALFCSCDSDPEYQRRTSQAEGTNDNNHSQNQQTNTKQDHSNKSKEDDISPSPPDQNDQQSVPNPKHDGSMSPFGIFGVFEFMLDGQVNGYGSQAVGNQLNHLKVQWVQEMPFEISKLPEKINVISRIGKEGGFQTPNGNLDTYKNALAQSIKQLKNRVKYYEVDTEPSGAPPPMGWIGYENKYFELLKVSYQTVKAECSDCKIVIGGVPGVGNVLATQTSNFYKKIFELGAANYFDVFSFKHHHFDAKDYTFLKNRLQEMQQLFKPYGDLNKKLIFIETATYDDQPFYPENNPLNFLKFQKQTEYQHAANLVKLYIYAIAQGVDLVLWNLIIERFNFANVTNNPFNHYGLIHNPKNDGKNHKKLAFFTLQKLIELLEGSNWSQIKTVVDNQNGLFVFEVVKSGSKHWIMWNDSNNDLSHRITSTKNIEVIDLVLPLQNGSEVSATNSEFKTTKLSASNASEIKVGKTPLLVREK